MKKKIFATMIGTAAAFNLLAVPAEKIESLPLDNFALPKRWAPAESSLSVSEFKFNGTPTLKWVVPVDHHAGEAKYPVGWPRTYFSSFRKAPAVPAAWQDWDFFEFDVKMTLENDPGNTSCTVTVMVSSAGTPSRFNIQLKKWHDGKTHTVKIPVDKIGNPAKITSWGFSIAESNYKHGAKLTFLAGNFRLTRSSECWVDSIKMLTPAITAADSAIKINLSVSGPAGDVARGVPFAISCAKTGKILRRETLPVSRGSKEMEIEVYELKLAPGNYNLTAFPGDKLKSKSVPFQILSSPYEEKK